MIEKLRPFLAHPMVKGIASVMTGNLAAQLLVIAATPILTRLYGPSDFGVYGTLLTTISIGSSIASLGLNMAIPKAATDKEASALAAVSTATALVAAPMLGVSAYLVMSAGYWRFGAIGPGLASAILALGLFVFTFYGTALYAAIRLQCYRWIAIARIVQYGGIVAAQLALASVAGAAGLALGHVIGFAGGALIEDDVRGI